MNIGYEKMYRDAVKRAEKAEAELKGALATIKGRNQTIAEMSRLVRDAQDRAEKAEAELAVLNAKGTPNQKAVQRFAIEQQIKGRKDYLGLRKILRVEPCSKSIREQIQQLRKELGSD